MLIIKVKKENKTASSEENKINAEKAFAHFKRVTLFTVKTTKAKTYHSKKK